MVLQLIDENWLRQRGLTAPREDMLLLAAAARTELERRVGLLLFDSLSDDQISEFENTPDDDKIDWLGEAYPDYKALVKRQLTIMEVELHNSPDIKRLILSWKQKPADG